MLFDRILKQAKEFFAMGNPAGLNPQAYETVAQLLDEATQLADKADYPYFTLPEAVGLGGYAVIREADAKFKMACAFACLIIMRPLTYRDREWSWLNKLATHLLRSWREPDPEMLVAFLAAYLEIANFETAPMLKTLVAAAENLASKVPLSDRHKELLQEANRRLAEAFHHNRNKETFKIRSAIQRLLDGRESGTFPDFLQSDAIGIQLVKWLKQESEADQKHWAAWLETCETEGAKTKPREKWLKQSRELLREIPEETRGRLFSQFLEDAAAYLQNLHKREGLHAFSLDWTPLPDWFCAVAWYAGAELSGYPEVRAGLQKTASWSYKKYPNVGSLSAKAGNACLRAYGLMPGIEGVNALLRFKAQAANRNILNLVETLLTETAKRQGISRGDIEDLGVDTFGLDAQQERFVAFGDYSARLAIQDQARAVLEWFKPDGSPLKSVPAVVRKEFKAELKRLQIEYKELQGALSAQSARIENSYLERRSWPCPVFRERFLGHPVLQTLAARLVWHWEENGRSGAAVWHEGNWQNPWGDPPPGEQAILRLWHPLDDQPQRVLEWRDWLEARRITQPFKQAYREIYVVTPPEITTGTYSNRFAAHILRQFQFAALCKQRYWQYSLQGAWDSHNIPYRELPDWNYRVEYWVDSAWNGPAGDTGVYLYINTDQVRFYHRGEEVRLTAVPPLLFSELMRDVDLFVGVCSIGNDPNWQDTGDERYRNYWNTYAFAEELSASGEARKAALERLIPRLNIAGQCSFEGKFLLVKGTRHTYKIHCGSGNILMSPHNQYLCIVPDSRPSKTPDKLYLPFEGDRLLSIIISKALLLAQDDKITDRTILAQL